MMTPEQIEKRRQALVQEMLAIRSMEHGTVTSQMVPGRRRGEKDPVLRGPYFVLARWEGGKTRSRRLTSPEAVEQARADVAAHRRFVQLCAQFEELTRQLGELERGLGEADDAKKNSRPPSKRTKRSGAS